VLWARKPSEIDNAFLAMSKERAEALNVIGSISLLKHLDRIRDLAAKNRLPSIFYHSTYVERGGLMSYSANIRDEWRRTARIIDMILKGANPADLPVEQATKFELVVNLKTAKQLGITIPPSILYRADKVIK
ncbi:MAG: ABC transporter substrate binding protein, partial [Candidatus Binatia bacterium]